MKKNYKILITGATGFIGKNLTNKLLIMNHKIMIISRKEQDYFDNINLKWVRADLADINQYSKIIRDFSPEIVIHLYWEDIPLFSLENSMKNLNNSINFFNLIFSIGSCKKILVSGSCLEYAKKFGECIESDNIKPNSHFVWAKDSLRLWLTYQSNLNNCIFGWFRIFYVFGLNQRKKSLIPSLIRIFNENKNINIKNIMNSNDFIYIEDVVDALILFTTKKLNSGIYNIGSGNSIKLADVCKDIESILRGTSFKTETFIENISNENGREIVNFWANLNKTSSELGWMPKFSFYEAIEHMVNQKNI